MRLSLPRRRVEPVAVRRQESVTSAEPADNSSAYILGRREWNERYGSYIQQAAHWRAVAFAALGVALTAVVWAGYRSSQSRFVPYVVEVDKLGDAVAVGPVAPAPVHDSRVIVAQLARWVSDVRSVYDDPQAEDTLLADAYTCIAASSPANGALDEWLQTHNPFKAGHGVSVTVAVHAVLPISQNVFRVTWTETVSGELNGGDGPQEWSAIITVKIVPPSTAAAIMKNPAGVEITNFSWSRNVD